MVLAMEAEQAGTRIRGLGDVRVRPVRGIEEQRRWDRLVATRNVWLGWSPVRLHARLCLLANNSRFLVLDRILNLASRVLGLSLRRLSQDMQALHGPPVVLCETFVDRSRFTGTCYRAANWRSLGFTRGYSRLPGGMPR